MPKKPREGLRVDLKDREVDLKTFLRCPPPRAPFFIALKTKKLGKPQVEAKKGDKSLSILRLGTTFETGRPQPSPPSTANRSLLAPAYGLSDGR